MELKTFRDKTYFMLLTLHEMWQRDPYHRTHLYLKPIRQFLSLEELDEVLKLFAKKKIIVIDSVPTFKRQISHSAYVILFLDAFKQFFDTTLQTTEYSEFISNYSQDRIEEVGENYPDEYGWIDEKTYKAKKSITFSTKNSRIFRLFSLLVAEAPQFIRTKELMLKLDIEAPVSLRVSIGELNKRISNCGIKIVPRKSKPGAYRLSSLQ